MKVRPDSISLAGSAGCREETSPFPRTSLLKLQLLGIAFGSNAIEAESSIAKAQITLIRFKANQSTLSCRVVTFQRKARLAFAQFGAMGKSVRVAACKIRD